MERAGVFWAVPVSHEVWVLDDAKDSDALVRIGVTHAIVEIENLSRMVSMQRGHFSSGASRLHHIVGYFPPRQTSGEHGEQANTQAPHVHCRRVYLAAEDLRCSVVNTPAGSVQIARSVDGQSIVTELDDPRGRNEKVLQFDVPVGVTPGVQIGDRVTHVPQQVGDTSL